MALVVTQGYALWLARNDGGRAHVGRVVAWRCGEGTEIDTNATPIVAFTTEDGRLMNDATVVWSSYQVFLGDSRDEALGFLRKSVESGRRDAI